MYLIILLNIVLNKTLATASQSAADAWLTTVLDSGCQKEDKFHGLERMLEFDEIDEKRTEKLSEAFFSGAGLHSVRKTENFL